MNSISAKQLTYCAMGAALISVCSWISIPVTIPFTLQTFAVCLISALFGFKKSIITVSLYILLGLIGIPVFSGFRGGIGTLLGVTGGYIIGFLFTAAIVGCAADNFRKDAALIISMVLGTIMCYIFGTAWFIILYTRSSGPVSIASALSWCVIPYIIPDAIKIALAFTLSKRLRQLLGPDLE